jgi:hypothetical protein
MAELPIEPHGLDPTPGDWKASVSNGKLLLPTQLALAAREQGVRTAEDFLSFAEAFPSAIAFVLQWPLPQVKAATSRLRRQLRDHVPPAVPESARPGHAFGAMDPRLLGNNKYR